VGRGRNKDDGGGKKVEEHASQTRPHRIGGMKPPQLNASFTLFTHVLIMVPKHVVAMKGLHSLSFSNHANIFFVDVSP